MIIKLFMGEEKSSQRVSHPGWGQLRGHRSGSHHTSCTELQRQRLKTCPVGSELAGHSPWATPRGVLRSKDPACPAGVGLPSGAELK